MAAVPLATRRPHWGNEAESMTFLGTVGLFASLPAPLLHRLAASCRPRRVQRGAFVFVEGEPAHAIYILAAGRIKIVRETADGREVILRLIGPGEILDGAGGWGESVYPASALAQEEVVVLALPAREFATCLDHHPDLGSAVVRELAGRLRDAETRIRDLQTEPVAPRIARTLLRLAHQTGVPSAIGITIGVPLSRQDLAELAGTTLSTASRTVSAWAQQGIVTVGREQVTISHLQALAAIAEHVPSPTAEHGVPTLRGSLPWCPIRMPHDRRQ